MGNTKYVFSRIRGGYFPRHQGSYHRHGLTILQAQDLENTTAQRSGVGHVECKILTLLRMCDVTSWKILDCHGIRDITVRPAALIV